MLLSDRVVKPSHAAVQSECQVFVSKWVRSLKIESSQALQKFYEPTLKVFLVFLDDKKTEHLDKLIATTVSWRAKVFQPVSDALQSQCKRYTHTSCTTHLWQIADWRA